jgi:hypothetical protein
VSAEEQRSARLDALERTVRAYAAARRARLEHSVLRQRRILEGRTGSERLDHGSVEAAADLVEAEIRRFLSA